MRVAKVEPCGGLGGARWPGVNSSPVTQAVGWTDTLL